MPRIMICRICNNAITSQGYTMTPGGEYVHSGECPPWVRRRKAVVNNRRLLKIKKNGAKYKKKSRRDGEETLDMGQVHPIQDMVEAFVSSPNLTCCHCGKKMIIGMRDMRIVADGGYLWAHRGCVKRGK